MVLYRMVVDANVVYQYYDMIIVESEFLEDDKG